jgi:hypothetical protein
MNEFDELIQRAIDKAYCKVSKAPRHATDSEISVRNEACTSKLEEFSHRCGGKGGDYLGVNLLILEEEVLHAPGRTPRRPRLLDLVPVYGVPAAGAVHLRRRRRRRRWRPRLRGVAGDREGGSAPSRPARVWFGLGLLVVRGRRREQHMRSLLLYVACGVPDATTS